MTKIIGLTGGIGSGKTTVANAFEKLGIPVYIADLRAKKIMEQPVTIALLIQVFGSAIFRDEKVDRLALSKIVFENPEKLQQLNKIVHPLVKSDFENWLKYKENYPFVIKEAAILFESGSYKDCYKIIIVTAPLETRISRIIKRDGISRDLILKKIASQLSDEDKMEKSDYVIVNNDLKSTINQVNKLYKILND